MLLGGTPCSTMLEPPSNCSPWVTLKMKVSDGPPEMTRLFPPERWISWVTRMTFCPPLPTMVWPETIWLKVCVGVSDAAAFDSANAASWIADMDIRTMPPATVVPPPLMLICAVLSASSTPLTCPPPEKLKFPFWPIPTLPLIRNGPLLRLITNPWMPSTANPLADPSALHMLGGGVGDGVGDGI